jgi:hypothetical protein
MKICDIMRNMSLKRGQATLVVLLLSLLGLTIALGAVSSSLKNVKQTTQTDSGTKALAGAESALEYGISQIDPLLGYSTCANGTVPLTNFPGFLASSQGNYSICSNQRSFLEYPNLTVNDVAVIDGSRIDITTPNRTLAVVWAGAQSAVEISALYVNNVGNFSFDRHAVNYLGFAGGGNNFSSPNVLGVPNPCIVPTGINQCGYASYTDTSCFNVVPTKKPGSYDLKLLRVRRLYSDGPVLICAKSPGNSEANLGAQQIIIEGWATTTDNTTRRVQATQVPSGLSGIFDYAIFTEGALIK